MFRFLVISTVLGLVFFNVPLEMITFLPLYPAQAFQLSVMACVSISWYNVLHNCLAMYNIRMYRVWVARHVFRMPVRSDSAARVSTTVNPAGGERSVHSEVRRKSRADLEKEVLE